MLKIQFKDKRQDPIWIIEKRYTIGSAADNHLAVADQSLNPYHARLLTKNNTLYLKDNNSPQGCYVNDQRVTEREILPGDCIRLGQVEFEILDPRESISQAALSDDMIPSQWSLVADSSWLAGQEFKIPAVSTTLGRSSQCDIVVPGTHLSRQHAQLTIKGSLLHVRDLTSSNGTFINDERITNGTARSGDRLRFDVYSFRLIGPDSDADKTRIRRPRQTNMTPVERKVVADELKHWKTKATSPGNREEQRQSAVSPWLFNLSIALCLTMAATLIYFVMEAK